MIELLKVKLWGEEIGMLRWANNNSYFTFNEDFLEKGIVLTPITNPHNMGLISIPGTQNHLYKSLPPFIADSLPDSWGSLLFDEWAKKNNIRSREITPLDKLSYIGKRGMGALEFYPQAKTSISKTTINIKDLIDLAEKIFNSKDNITILPEETLTLQSLISLGTSAGGRMPKAIIAVDGESRQIKSGQTTANDKYKYYILKFGDSTRSTAEIEQTYYELAKEAGIKMAESALMTIEGKRHFLTERFDRKNGEKIFTQTLAAVNPDADSYEKLFDTCRKLRISEQEIAMLFRQMVFNVIMNNTDDHTKNFSFTMNKQGEWHIAPAYDLTFIFNLGGYQGETNHCLPINGKISGITYEDIQKTAAQYNIRNPQKIVNEIFEVSRKFKMTALKNGVKQEWISRIEHQINENAQTLGLKKGKEQNYTIEQAYKGNYIFRTTIDGKEQKYVITPKSEFYGIIEQTGIDNVPESVIEEIIEKCVMGKMR